MENRRHNRIEPWDEGVYGTGKTEPPKESSGMIALLMIVIIFLSGIISVLSFMNIQMFHQLQQAQHTEDSVPMVFSQMEVAPRETDIQALYEELESVQVPILGIAGEFISTFDQHYFSWPPGLLVTIVNEKGMGKALGLETGDILTGINGMPLSSQQELEQILEAGPSQSYKIQINRDGAQMVLDSEGS